MPLLLTQLIQVVFQLGDQAIIGRTHLHEFAGVSIASSFLFLITGTIGMIVVAFNIIGAYVGLGIGYTLLLGGYSLKLHQSKAS